MDSQDGSTYAMVCGNYPEPCGNEKCPLPRSDRSFMPCTIKRLGQLFGCQNFVRGEVARKERKERMEKTIRDALTERK